MRPLQYTHTQSLTHSITIYNHLSSSLSRQSGRKIVNDKIYDIISNKKYASFNRQRNIKTRLTRGYMAWWGPDTGVAAWSGWPTIWRRARGTRC